MPTSGSSNYNLQRDQIITQAFLVLGVINPADNLDPEDVGVANAALNLMIKSWESDGIYLWANVIGTLFAVAGQREYIIGPGTTDHCASGGYYNTYTTQQHLSGSTTINILSTSGTDSAVAAIHVNDKVGIQLDNNTLFWTTVATVPNTTSFTIPTPTTSSSASGNQVYTYTTDAGKPLQITSARYRPINGPDRRITDFAREDYFYIPNKTSAGVITAYYYNPGLTTGTMDLWMVPQYCTDIVEFNYYRILQDFDNSTDLPDFPTEWIETIIYNLATRLGTIYGKDQKLLATIQPKADQLYENLRDWAHEMTYVKTEPKFGGYYE